MLRNFIILPALIAAFGSASLHGQSAEQIMERARLSATLQNNELSGTIRKDRSRIPVHLFLKGENIQFQYMPDGKTWVPFHMRLGDDQFNLFEFKGGKTIQFDRAKLAQPVAGSDLTFEDLSMRFFYWPNPQLLGSERVGVHDCWKIRINNPGNTGAYSVVYAWIHKEFGAFMKVEGFDRQGNKLKQFTVEEVQKLPDKTYTLKQMKAASFRGGRTAGISYLEFDKPKGPGGMR